MPSELADRIANISVIDTHSHMSGDSSWEGPDAPDIRSDLFGGYCSSDLIIAGASPDAIARLQDSSDADLEGRFAGVATAWNMTQFTGYGEAVRTAARDLYDIEELNATTIRAGRKRLQALQRTGGCLALLRDRAKLDHIQTDLGLGLELIKPNLTPIIPNLNQIDPTPHDLPNRLIRQQSNTGHQ